MELNVVGETLPQLTVESVKAYHGPFTPRLQTVINTIRYIVKVCKGIILITQ